MPNETAEKSVRLDMRRTEIYGKIAICLLAILGFAFIVRASYPGYMHADNVYQFEQIYLGRYYDWQPPFIVALWMGLMKIFPAQAGILILNNLLIWGALTVCAFVIRRRVGAWALLVFALPFMPGMLNLLGHVNRDIMLVAWMMAAFSCAFLANGENIGGGKRLMLRILTGLFAIAAFLVRGNVVFALAPLLLYAYFRLGWVRNLLTCALLVVVMPVTQNALDRLMEVTPTYPGSSIKVMHLEALSYFAGKNLFPGKWDEIETRWIVEGCYTPTQFDPLAIFSKTDCSIVQANLDQQGLWGSHVLTKAWLSALVDNPLGAYAAMAAAFRQAMREPYALLILEPPAPSTALNDLGIELRQPHPPYRITTAAARQYMQSGFNLVLGKPMIFAAACVAAMVLLLILRLGKTRLGLFALALAGSGMIYLLTYFPLTVSSHFRYFYWSGFAGWLGLLLAIIAWFAHRKEERHTLPGLMRLGVGALVAATVALVTTSPDLPTERRTIKLTPQGGGEIAIDSIRAAATPPWEPPFDGDIQAPGWIWQNGWHSADSSSALITTFESLHMPVRVHFSGGPDKGKVRIEDLDENGKVLVIDTRWEKPQEILIFLSPPRAWTRQQRQGSWHAPARAGLLFVILTVLLFRMTGDRKQRTDFLPTAKLPT